MKISAVIATFNEEKNIKRCLNSLDFVNEIIIIDSKSSDNTLKIAESFTKKIFIKEFTGFSKIKQSGIDKAKGEWIFIVDADEEVSAELKNKIKKIINDKKSLDGYYIKRETYFLGKKIKYCGWGKDFQLRLFKKAKGAYDGKIVHESIKVKGKIGYIKEPLYHYSYPDSKIYFEKMNKYTSLQAKESKKGFLFLKLIFNPFFKFFKMYFLRLGFLDGIHGFILSLYSSFSEFVKFAKMIENNEPNYGLVIRTPNWIGDAAISTAFLKEAKRVFKKLYVLADKKVSSIFENNSFIDELIVFDKKNLFENIKVIYKMRRYKIKIGVTLTPSFSSSLIFFLAGIKKRAGFSKDGFLLNFKFNADKKHREHIIEEYKKIFYLVSYEFDFKNNKQEIFLNLKQEKEILSKFNFDKKFFKIIISPFVQYGPAKMWDIKNVEILIKSLIKRFKKVKIYIIGTEEDKKYKILNDNIIDLRGQTSLKEIIYLIKNTNFFIGNDSGIMHIADAFNIPSIIIFGSTSPLWTGPVSQNLKIIKSNVNCSPCFQKECKYKTYECLKIITVERVLKEAIEMIKKI